MKIENKKLIIIGIDGGTWKVLRPLINAGKLPNLAQIINNGIHGDLQSTFPPSTIPAWLSMATGKNPGKLGVFDFMTKNEKDFSGKVIHSSEFKRNNTYWDLLNRYGYRTYLINHPLLYPYYDIDGVMVGGMGLPAYANKTHPAHLESELDDITGGYRTSLIQSTKNKDKLVKDLKEILEKQFKAVHFLLNQKWDLFLHVSSISDWLQHGLWEDWVDTNSKNHKDFLDIYVQLDNKIGAILKQNVDVNFLVVSDHGFGALKENFNLSKWLYKNGYMKKKHFALFRKYVRLIIHFLYKHIKDKLIGKYLNIKKFHSGVWQKQLNIGLPIPPEIDIKKSIVIPGHTSGTQGFIYIKDTVKNHDKLKKEIIEKLKRTGEKYEFDIRIYDPKELYHGNKFHLAPDIIFKINNFRCNIQISTLKGETFSTNVSFKNMSGIHRSEGIFIAYGPDMKKGRTIKGATIYDIAPTILHMFNVPIPKDTDGVALKEIFRDDSVFAKKEIKYERLDDHEKLLLRKIKGLKLNGKI